jgi:hypothetical protein
MYNSAEEPFVAPGAILKSAKPAQAAKHRSILFFREEFISYQTIKTLKLLLINY